MAYVYLITCHASGKYYVGKTQGSPKTRLRTHISNRNYKGSHIAHAIRKYGAESFTVQTLAVCSEDELDNLEKLWIACLNATDRTVGMNIKLGGEGGPIALETREKISKANKGRIITDEWRANMRAASPCLSGPDNGFYGRSHSEETKKHWSDIRKGMPAPNKGKLGKPLSPDHKAKLIARNTKFHIGTDKVVELYKLGYGLKAIGKIFGVSETPVRSRLKVAGIQIEHRTRKWTPEERASISARMMGNKNGFKKSDAMPEYE